ncbi:DUF1513 domain-containing protein [Sedimentitalea sp. JM2-8]|uniref:DUF1513 domain-containing protein n=1 Tax=Sedimentitalea xiamensis TaxID=3050037 RepID=A0ABT7FIH6_9RHOB|nr:DUF1513 domain-containing protein [Sedimentitalea xiamensis]MDK3074594.1 DUF1513 domain-containing protein [Sedimentitalea xiamensis]
MTTRRGFLASLAAAAAAPSLTWADAGSPEFLAAAKEPDGGFALFGLTARGQVTFRIPLPARGHAGAGHPVRPEAVTFARRPGTHALVIDCVHGTVIQRLTAPGGHHFSGHGAFSADGRTLFTAEIDSVTGLGGVGLWRRSDGYDRVGGFASGGIGPHELLRLPGRDILVIANGGIVEGGGDGRTKLNLDTMRPNLSYMTADGELLDRVDLPPELRGNSIRHIAAHPDRQVAFAMQWEHDRAIRPPLLGLHRPGSAPRLCAVPDALAPRLANYAGSVSFSGDGAQVAITCPKGGSIAIFDRSGAFIDLLARADVCGIGRIGSGGFLTTDGLGGLMELSSGRLRPLAAFDRAWDNHLIGLRGATTA